MLEGTCTFQGWGTTSRSSSCVKVHVLLLSGAFCKSAAAQARGLGGCSCDSMISIYPHLTHLSGHGAHTLMRGGGGKWDEERNDGGLLRFGHRSNTHAITENKTESKTRMLERLTVR